MDVTDPEQMSQPSPVTMDVHFAEGVAVLHTGGEIDVVTAPEFEQKLTEVAAMFLVVADGPATARPMKLVGLADALEIFPTVEAALSTV